MHPERLRLLSQEEDVLGDLHHHLVADASHRDRFELVFYLHFADDSDLDESDRFAKVRPLITRMNGNSRSTRPWSSSAASGSPRAVPWAPRAWQRHVAFPCGQ